MRDPIATGYHDPATAEKVREELLSARQEYLFDLPDAVIATRGERGHVKANQLVQSRPLGARPGPFWGPPLRPASAVLAPQRAALLAGIGKRERVIPGVSLRAELRRAADFLALMKPRVMSLAVFTALVGLIIAPGHLHPIHAAIAILAIAAGAGAAGVLNMWYDADIDAVMARTAMRPIPRGRVSQREALVFGLLLAAGAVAVLGFALNVTAAALLAFAIFFYIVVYTVWLKRHTPQNIVIGGAAGALPPVIGWAAATGDIGLESFILFLMVFLWTPPHFWALSINRTHDYVRAGVPMLPVVAGRAATTRQILIYCTLLQPVSMLPWALGFAGPIYGATAFICGASLIVLAFRLSRSGEADRRPAYRLFVFSISYLFLLFAALLADHNSGPGLSKLPSRDALRAAGSVQVARLASPVRAPCCSTNHKVAEV
jgi:heme o synthase